MTYRTCSNRVLPLVGLTLAALLFVGCGKEETVGESIAEIQKREGVPVSVEIVSAGTLRSIERAGGTVEGYAQADLGAMVPGVLTRYRAKVGSRVGKGAVLAVVDPDIQNGVAMAKANFDQISKSRERVKALADEGGVSQEVVDQLETGYTVAREQLEAATKSQNVLAPFAGTVVSLMVPVNSKVGPGQGLVKFADLRRVRVTLDINETLINRLATGQQAFVVMDSDTLFGKVEKVPIGAREAGHMFPVDVVFPNKDGRFKPGMFVTVNVITVEMPDAVSVPAEVIQYDDMGPYVYTVDGDVARKTVLELGTRGEDRMSVNAGLTVGDRLVVTGASRVSDGIKVKVVE